jgi:hypothetical protein
VLGAVFLVAGTISAAIIGAAAYIVVAAVGSLWLPGAAELVGLHAYQRDRAEDK